MKVGDLVVITDGSYIQEITSNGLKSVRLNCGEAKGLPYVVAATDCAFPIESDWQPDDYRNDTIICGAKGCVDGRFFVVHQRFLSSAKHTIVIDGKTVEISHESYVELKRSLQ